MSDPELKTGEAPCHSKEGCFGPRFTKFLVDELEAVSADTAATAPRTTRASRRPNHDSHRTKAKLMLSTRLRNGTKATAPNRYLHRGRISHGVRPSRSSWRS